ncbi:MAG: nicotinate phosphoribosyltransferase [Eggerthellaceae bacterium]
MQNKDYALLTDLYQITMAQGYWACNKLEEQGCFHIFFREPPFQGGFAIASGMDHIAEVIENFSMSDENIDYLASLDAPGGGKLFDPDFLEYLRNLELSVDIDAIREGTVVFPNDPFVRVIGPVLQCQLLETQLLNCVNFETLAATKAARVCLAAQTPVAEFGLRRAQGESGGMRASRACIVGGCASTSNVLAGKTFGLPVSGTHAHAWVMAFDSELEAFRAYARTFPTNCVLLVDTYDVEQGIKNAITVGLEMKERGEHLTGIRIDSGDLAWEAKLARKMLDEAGLTETGVVLSNDLDEFSIKSIIDSGAQVASWGVGTKLVTAYDQPALGGVYKLAAKRVGTDSPWEPCLKVTGQSSKQTVPGVLDVRRYFHSSGKLAGDMVFDTTHGVAQERIIDPADELRQKDLAGKDYVTLLEPLARHGKVVLDAEHRNALVARDYCHDQLELLDESQKRIMNPHSYPVGLEYSLFYRRHELASRLLGLS